MMKRLFILISLFVLAVGAGAQTITVLDNATLQPLPHVVVQSQMSGASAVTSSKGQAEILGLAGADSVQFRCVGYQSKKIGFRQLQEMKYQVLLVEKRYALDEVIISASRFGEKKSDIPQQVQVIRSKDIQFASQQNCADLMQNTGNILVQKSQMGGGSPIIRGFEASKVLLVVDGVRLNNAIYRVGHLQNIITIDNSILDKTEIVFGPGSVVYGSDALGGVMHFYTRNPELADSGKKFRFNTSAYTRYATANTEKTGHVDFNIGLKKFAFLSSITYSDFGDMRQGAVRDPFYGEWGKRKYYAVRINGADSMMTNSNINIQKYTGYKQYDLLQKILYRQSSHISHILNLQYSVSSDIPRYDRLTDTASNGKLKSAQWYYGPQKRFLGAYHVNLKADKGIYSEARIVLAYQDIEESRHNRNFNSSKLNHRTENVKLITLNADFGKNISNHELRYGIEGAYNIVTSKASLENILTGISGPLDTRYPDGGSVMQTIAAYITHSWEIDPKFIISDGIRFSNIMLNAKFNDTTFFPFPFTELTQNSNALNGNLGLAFMPGFGWRFSLLGSTGFRAPNVDDLTKVFESVPGKVLVPNPHLKPEYTYNAEMGISKAFGDKILFDLVGYYTLYKNVLATRSGKFNGQDSIHYDGALSQVTTTTNAGEGFVWGISGNLMADITDAFSITSSLNYTFGKILTDSTLYPLDHIPPVFGKTSFNLSIKKFRSEFYVMYNGWKRLDDYNRVGEDNLVYASSQGMPAWYTLNLRTGWQINKFAQVQLAMENILDQNYRVFGSGIGAAGRNLVVTLRGRF